VKRVQCDIDDGIAGYRYLVLDMNKRHVEMMRVPKRYVMGDTSLSDVQEVVRTVERFALMSSFMIPLGTVLDNYYLRHTTEHYYDLVNGYVSPLQ